MLVLLSFGLVLVATVLLVIGLLSESGLALIYVSIGSSALAGIVLIVAVRMAKTKAAVTEEPEPLPDEEVAEVTAVVPTPDRSTVSETATRSAPEPEPEPEPVGSSEAWAESAPEWGAEDLGDTVDFPIADYDELRVDEILPLLPQLYSDELDVVEARERSGKSRVTILNRIGELRVTGTEADAEVAGEPGAVSPPEPAGQPEPATVPASSAEDFDTGFDDDFDADLDDEDFFPIENYDNLTVKQIVPLLEQLEDDELEDVRAREQAGSARKMVLSAIDDRIGAAAPAAKAPARKKAARKKAPARKKAARKKAPARKKAARKKAPAKKRRARKRGR